MATQPTNIKVLLAKLGLDGHDRGIKVIARAMRDAGMEVIYMGMRFTPDQVAQTALQEDVDVVGISILSGAHMELFPQILDQLKARGLDDKVVLAGGIIPEDDIPLLKKMGIKEVFGPGTNTRDIIAYIRDVVDEARKSAT